MSINTADTRTEAAASYELDKMESMETASRSEKAFRKLSSPRESSSSWRSSAEEPLLVNADELCEKDHNLDDTTEAPTHEEKSQDEKKPFLPAHYKTTAMNFVRIFSYSTWTDRLLILLALCASITTGITLPFMNVVFGDLVGAFSAFYNPATGDTKEEFVLVVNKYVLYLVYLFMFRLFFSYIALLCFRVASVHISANVRLAYLRALFVQPISTLDVLPPGQTSAILTVTSDILQIGISEKLSTLLQNISLVCTAFIVALYYSWILTIVTSSGFLIIVVLYFRTVPRLVKAMADVEQADRTSSSIASEAFSSIRMVAACEAEGKMAERHAEWVGESKSRGLLMSPILAMQQAPIYFTIHATFALAFWVAIKLYTGSQGMSVTTIIIVLSSIMAVVMSIGGIVAPATAAIRAAGAAGIFYTILDAPKPRAIFERSLEQAAQNNVVFENVNFTYPLRPDVKVLENLSISFPAGKVTAIVGESGSGKSTIMGLIERWYELDGSLTGDALTLYFRNGTITAGGVNIHEIDLKSWRSKIGLVQQEPFLFNDTIFKNVEYGLVGTEHENRSPNTKMKLVKKACEEAFADEFIARLPEGYDTMVGNAGIKLSGGQRQRLAIARSIIKSPTILILDEATSAIDARGEKIVQAALDRVSKDRTTIVIAHRLSTITKADKIIVLQKGKAVQQGTHDELLADRDGSYWALVSAQQLMMSEGIASSIDEYIPRQDDSSATELESTGTHSIDLESRTSSDDLLDRPKQFKSSIGGSFGLFLLEQRARWAWYSLMFLGSLGAGIAFPLHAYLFARLISLFSFTGEYLQHQTNWWCFMFILLAVGVGMTYFVLAWAANTISFNITAIYRQEYFQNVLNKRVSFHDEEENSVGSLTARMASDPTQLQQLLGINMAIVCISAFNIIGCVSMSFYFGWKLTLVTVCSAMPIILAAGFIRVRHEIQFERMNQEVFAESSRFAAESIGAIRTVSSLVLESEICDRYASLLRNHAEKACRKARLSVFVFAISDSISFLCMALVLWYGGRLLASHEYSPFNYLVIYLAIVQGSTSAGQSLSFGPNIVQAFAAANRIRSMRPQEDIQDALFEAGVDDPVETEKGSHGVKIELKHVSLAYPTRDIPVLRDLSMTIEKGQFAAIVGPSGCGKTSIISLLERFYEAQNGQILYNDRDISAIPMSSYRKSISLVAQEASLFSGSIRSNILLGVDTDSTTEQDLHHACRSAEIHDFISSLPEGYDTIIGANGVSLSGGQKQRLAIARALIRKPRLLLLDEATSSLDSETERDVQRMLERERNGKTTVLVTHRLATVQNADVIFVIGDGRVVERGDHRGLLKRKGVYWQMCQAQALDR